MVSTENYASHYSGRCYGIAEAQKIESILAEKCATGDSYQWVYCKTKQPVALSGNYKLTQTKGDTK